jgi:hypothetical protein
VAGYQKWTVSEEKDPFSGGEKVTAEYALTARSAVLILCDSTGNGFELRAVAGWRGDSSLEQQTPTPRIAIDGDILDVTPSSARGSLFGNSIAGIVANYNKSDSRQIINAWKTAKSQIAIADSISSGPHLMTARGSTRAGQRLETCLDKQEISPAGYGPQEAITREGKQDNVLVKESYGGSSAITNYLLGPYWSLSHIPADLPEQHRRDLLFFTLVNANKCGLLVSAVPLNFNIATMLNVSPAPPRAFRQAAPELVDRLTTEFDNLEKWETAFVCKATAALVHSVSQKVYGKPE